jgi:hypothetical protein
MADITTGLRILESLTAGGEQDFTRRLLLDLLNADGQVRFTSATALHVHLCRLYGFTLRRNTHEGVQAGGRHLFYVHGNVLLRVKTSGTRIRPRPHMTISEAVGLDWNQEAAKFSRDGSVMPKLGSSRAGSDWRALMRIGDYNAIEASDQRWADLCHFDFVAGFSDAGAAAVTAQES